MPLDTGYDEQLDLLNYIRSRFRERRYWVEPAARVHEILLDRHEDLSRIAYARDVATPGVVGQLPCGLAEERALVANIRDDPSADVAAALGNALSANLWWRWHLLRLLLSWGPAQLQDDSITWLAQAAIVDKLLAAAGLATTNLPEVSAAETPLDDAGIPDDVTLHIGRERRLIDTLLPQQSQKEAALPAASRSPIDRDRGITISGEVEYESEGPEDEFATAYENSLDDADDADDADAGDSGDSRRDEEFPYLRAAASVEPETPVTATIDLTETLTRTPHINIGDNKPLKPGSEFVVELYADEDAARPAERVEVIRIVAPASFRRFELRARLNVSRHFEIVERPTAPLAIERGKPESNRLTFKVRALPSDQLKQIRAQLPALHRGSIHALFSYEGQPCGRVGRVVELDLATPPPAAAEVPLEAATASEVPPPENVVEIRPKQQAADIIVTITEDDDRDNRHYHCTVRTELEETTGKWTLRQASGDIVNGFMNSFTEKGKSGKQMTAALRGAGIELFDASPLVFQRAFWRLIETGRTLHTIQVNTQEPNFLWELMLPTRTGLDDREPLGVEFTVGRWITANGTTPPQTLTIDGSYVVAPEYISNKLKHAQAEANLVCELFKGENIQPADYDQIWAKLQINAATLLHFACHGKEQNELEQAIMLADNGKLTPIELRGEKVFRDFFRRQTPLVFINACEVGRQQVSLEGAGGFAATMIKMGAQGVIAAAWSVKDNLAHEIARHFYDTLKTSPETPPAQIFKNLGDNTVDSSGGGAR